MAARLAAATDGTTLLDGELGATELSANTVMQLTQRDSNTRVYCAHGWADLERLATDLFRKLPHATSPQSTGIRGTFDTRGHFYNLSIRWDKTIVDFADVRNITRDNEVVESAADFGGDSELETTWNIARSLQAHKLQGTTIGAAAMNNYISGDYRRFREKFPPLDATDYKRMRASYFGSYLQAEAGEYAECSSWDVNSLYPYIMRNLPLPYGTPERYEGEYVADKGMPLHVDIISFAATLKKDKCPTLTNLLPLWGFEHVRLPSTFGVVTMPLTDVDQQTLRENYDVDIYEIQGGWKFRKSQGHFQAYVDEWFHVKQSETGTRKRIAKLMLNSLVGKFGASINRPMMEPVLDESTHELRFDVKPTNALASLAYMPVAAYVNAYGRQILTRAINQNQGRVIYADTDSMIVTGLDVPHGIEASQNKLGAWKNDYRYRRLRILGPRKYCGETIEGETVMRLSGVKHRDTIPYDSFFAGNRLMNDYGQEFVL